MNNPREILRLEEALCTEPGADISVPVSMVLRSGQSAVICDPGRSLSDLPDIVIGRKMPQSGSVSYKFRKWGTDDGNMDFVMRTTIGRIWSPGDKAWINNLSIMENIMLAQRHCESSPDVQIRNEAESLLSRLGFSGDAGCRPETSQALDLVIAGWARALIGHRDLLVIGYPESELCSDLLGALSAIVTERLEGGAAALWLLSESSAASQYHIRSTYAYAYANGLLTSMEK